MKAALLETRKLKAGYLGREVVRAVNLRVDAGEVVCLLGPNGAGKSTTLLTIAGELAPVDGIVMFSNVPTFTPVDQLPVVSVTELALAEMTVLPLRVSDTTTLPVGACPSRTFAVPVPPLARLSDVGLITIVRGLVVPSTVNGMIAELDEFGGVAVSNAVACTVWLPAASAALV